MTVKPINEVVALVWDNGLFVELARKLGQRFKKVYYHCPWQNGFPKMNQAMIGYGIEEIEIVHSPWGPWFDQADVIVFPDVYFGPEQEYIESHYPDKLVWGSRMGEDFELERAHTKELMRSVGLPVNEYAVVTGIEDLKKYLKSHNDVWVKISRWRGHMETFPSPNFKLVEPRITELELQLGGFAPITEFIVENGVNECEEFGVDGYCIDGEMPSHIFNGFEVKDKGDIGKIMKYGDVPEPITRWERLMKPFLKEVGYRGFMSTEVRITPDKTPYMIDFCARAGSPPNELYQELFTNLAEIIYFGAIGKMVDLKQKAEWGAEILIHSSWADKNWQPITFPESLRENIKLRNCVKIKGIYYAIPQTVGLPEIGAAVGYGATMEDAIKMAKEVAKSIEGYYIEPQDDALDDAVEVIENANKMFPGMM